MNIRTPLLKGSKQSPATENLAEGPFVAVVTFVQTPVSTLRSEMKDYIRNLNSINIYQKLSHYPFLNSKLELINQINYMSF